MALNSIAIRTSYQHHAANSGYKQILRYTKPKAIFGVDENKETDKKSLKTKYKWLYEFEAFRYSKTENIDIVHILYGEEYFRFSTLLFRKIPIVVTFHQPPGRLQKEIENGDTMGKFYGLTHKLTKNRFKKIDKAIVVTNAQKDVLRTVMSEDKIEIIPLGVDLNALQSRVSELKVIRDPNLVVTVGNWKRDWSFYFDFVKYCESHHPDWKFILINRKLENKYQNIAKGLTNLEYKKSVSDGDLYGFYKKASLQFLPFEDAAGNNSINESLALGCPIVTNQVGVKYRHQNEFIKKTDLRHEDVAHSIDFFMNKSSEAFDVICQKARESVKVYDWENIGKATMDLYSSLL